MAHALRPPVRAAAALVGTDPASSRRPARPKLKRPAGGPPAGFVQVRVAGTRKSTVRVIAREIATVSRHDSESRAPQPGGPALWRPCCGLLRRDRIAAYCGLLRVIAGEGPVVLARSRCRRSESPRPSSRAGLALIPSRSHAQAPNRRRSSSAPPRRPVAAHPRLPARRAAAALVRSRLASGLTASKWATGRR